MKMADVRIFSPARNVMQSAPFTEGTWIVQYLGAKAKTADPIMGWTSSSDVQSCIRLSFATKEEAIAYCEAQDLTYELNEPKKRKVQIKSYAQTLMQDPTL